MKNNIYSTFDLSKSLKQFQEKVTKLLELTNIPEFDVKYNEVASQKLPLGSGAVESLIRQVVNLRMKGNSKFWLKDNAEIM